VTFVSLEFILFFCIVVPGAMVLPWRWRTVLLLVASLFFYAFGAGGYLLVLLFSMGIDYNVGMALARTRHPARRALLLCLSLVGNFGVLFTFKYANFVIESLNAAFSALGVGLSLPAATLPLPIGISFYTFQSVAYTIDVYRRAIEPERSPLVFGVFVSFFPQLVAGPISRAGLLLPQLRARVRFDADRTIEGLRLILWGFFKKIVISDNVAGYVNAIYDAPYDHTGLPLILATLMFSIQIYCDFSAYSDIAIGTARILGVELAVNFRQPYLARSVREFWSRWHISLSTWFRDYLYIPLGGSRVAFPRALLNLFIVFLVSGLWHGASWTFVFWGALHGGFVVFEAVLHRVRGEPRARLGGWAGWLMTFALVNTAWIFFRAGTIEEAFYILTYSLAFASEGWSVSALAAAGGWTAGRLVLAGGLVLLLFGADVLDARAGLMPMLDRLPGGVRWAIYYGMTGAVFLALNALASVQQFIYFQF
jgi:D-alanyl-lipoteichoic acid acyltransferase DltB (MBOAT superfamily)